MLGSFTTQSMLGMQLPKELSVYLAVPQTKPSTVLIPPVASYGKECWPLLSICYIGIQL